MRQARKLKEIIRNPESTSPIAGVHPWLHLLGLMSAASGGKSERKIQSSEERQAGLRNSADAEKWTPNKGWAETLRGREQATKRKVDSSKHLQRFSNPRVDTRWRYPNSNFRLDSRRIALPRFVGSPHKW